MNNPTQTFLTQYPCSDPTEGPGHEAHAQCECDKIPLPHPLECIKTRSRNEDGAQDLHKANTCVHCVCGGCWVKGGFGVSWGAPGL